MTDTRKVRLVLATAAFGAVAALFAGGANAMPMDVDGGAANGALTTSSGQLTGVHAILQRNRSIGLTGDSPLTRVSAPEPEGLIGDSAVTRYPGIVTTPVASGDDDIDWTSFGAGAGLAVLLATAAAAGVLTTRRRRGVAVP